jgi:hypothetical protein
LFNIKEHYFLSDKGKFFLKLLKNIPEIICVYFVYLGSNSAEIWIEVSDNSMEIEDKIFEIIPIFEQKYEDYSIQLLVFEKTEKYFPEQPIACKVKIPKEKFDYLI